MRTYASSRVKRKSFYRKSEHQMFLLIFGGHIGRLHTKLYKGALNVSANNSETVGHKDLRLGQIVYILVFYNISFSRLLPLDGFQLFFFFVPCLLCDSENEEYMKLPKDIHTQPLEYMGKEKHCNTEVSLPKNIT